MPSHPHTHGLTVDPGQDTWRTVVIDDRVPVDLFGRPLLVGCMPLALWPLLLSKAVLKVRVERGTRCAVPVSVSVLHPHVRLIPHLFCDDECVVEDMLFLFLSQSQSLFLHRTSVISHKSAAHQH